jgi:hypothetical protein
MGVFFKSESLRSAITPALTTALTKDPKTVANPDQEAAEKAEQIAARVAGTFSWVRLLVALALLTLLFLGAVKTGRDPALQQLYTVLLHGLEVGLGGVLGLLVGESTARG